MPRRRSRHWHEVEMKFVDFKTSEVEKQSNVIAASLSEAPNKFAGRTIVRDWNADPWDTDSLDARMCPACGADVSHRPGIKSTNVAYYECKEKSEHKFARIFSPPSTTASTLAAAAAHTTKLLESARVVAERSKHG